MRIFSLIIAALALSGCADPEGYYAPTPSDIQRGHFIDRVCTEEATFRNCMDIALELYP